MSNALTSLEAMVLGYLSRPGEHSVADLSAQALLTISETNFILKKMEEQGLVQLSDDIILPGQNAKNHPKLPIFAPMVRDLVKQVPELAPSTPVDVKGVIRQAWERLGLEGSKVPLKKTAP